MLLGKIYRGRMALLAAITGFSFCAPAVWAADNASISGIAIGTFQAASPSTVDGQDIHSQANGQFLLSGELTAGPGVWQMEVRGGTTPRSAGVSSFYDSNASVGETLDANGRGRIAVTQLFYELPAASGKVRAGLLDSAAVLDGDPIANNEYEQFLAGAFVNNPTIGLPGFALGAAYQGQASADLSYTLFVSSSNGLENENDPSYANLVSVDDQGKGLFTAAQADWQKGTWFASVGLWRNGADYAKLDDPADSDNNAYGVYASLGSEVGPGLWSARLGVANERVQADANFISLAYNIPVKGATLGAAISRRGDSSHLSFNAKPSYQAEIYWRAHIGHHFYLSPDVQYIENSGFHADRDGLVAGLRLGASF